MILNIKNMVCNRCIKVVEEELRNLGYDPETIELGSVKINKELTGEELRKIEDVLISNGFELIQDSKKKIVEKIKSTIIDRVHHFSGIEKIIFSKTLEEKLGRDYSTLSKIFSAVENKTIEHFIILQKIEKVKELLRYGELTLSEIAYKLGYKSVNHLSAQFKKHTGLTATQFKKTTSLSRKPLDKV